MAVEDMSNVWDYYRGDNVTVAVIDSGFDNQSTHTLINMRVSRFSFHL